MPPTLTKQLSLNSVSIGGLGNTWETPTCSVAAVIQQCQNPVFPWAFLEIDLKIHVLLEKLAAAVASVVGEAVALASLNDLKIQLCSFKMQNYKKRPNILVQNIKSVRSRSKLNSHIKMLKAFIVQNLDVYKFIKLYWIFRKAKLL